MSIDSYANLKQAIERFSHRTDISDLIDDFIDLAENTIDKQLRLRANESRERASAPTSDRFLALPTRFVEMRRLQLINGSVTKDIKFKAPEALKIADTSGEPKYFTITSQIEFDRTPSSAYTIEVVFYKGLNPLSSSNTSNNVLTNYPDLYLYASLYHLNNWTGDDEQMGKYLNLFNAALTSANKQEMRGRFGAAPVIGLEGWTP